MTEEEVEELTFNCPILYHMAAKGSWPSIRERGLLSTTALLDLYGVSPRDRDEIESCRRSDSISLVHPELPTAVIRDQSPMDDRGLTRCLPPHISPTDWYRMLNRKVFFWLSRGRLLRLTNAGAYRQDCHDVIELDARALIAEYGASIWLCPINSGCTKPMPHPRDEHTFSRIPEYPYSHWRKRRKFDERVVELSVDYAVPNAAKFVQRVVEMRGSEEIRVLFAT